MNRLAKLQKKLIGSGVGTESPDDMMLKIMEALGDIEYAPDSVGAFYTFVYQAKTPELLYDEHPLVEIVEITRWGFKGFNYHWNMVRNYTFPEIIGPMYRVNAEELSTLRTLPYKKFRVRG
jgi:hypothetical protein